VPTIAGTAFLLLHSLVQLEFPQRLLRLLLQLGSLERKPIGYPCNLVWSPTLFASQSPPRRNPSQGSLLLTSKVVEIEQIQAELVQVIMTAE